MSDTRMPARPFYAALAAAALAISAQPAVAMEHDAELMLGRTEYVQQCAACHGMEGRGDGPVASVLAKKPLDLTTIKSRYSGQYPADAIKAMVDGRNMINPHGDRGMPVWGDRYFQVATERAQTVPHDVDAQAMASGRIAALVTYLESIQQE